MIPMIHGFVFANPGSLCKSKFGSSRRLESEISGGTVELLKRFFKADAFQNGCCLKNGNMKFDK